MNIAVLGPKGTFSDKAYLEYVKVHKDKYGEQLVPVYCTTIDDVFEHVQPKEEISDSCEIGIVPIENTLDGYVFRTLDLLLEKDVFISDQNIVPVQFSCIGNVSVQDNIKKLYVQFKANGQCRKFINSLHKVSIITTESNIDSFYKLGDEKESAAIVPEHIANNATNQLIINNVTDSEFNHTRFVVFTKEKNVTDSILKAKTLFKKQDMYRCESVDRNTMVRIPVYIMPACDKPGVLYNIVRIFYENQINLISIISRPTKQIMGHYNFYIEIEGFYDQLDIILATINKIGENNGTKILGMY